MHHPWLYIVWFTTLISHFEFWGSAVGTTPAAFSVLGATSSIIMIYALDRLSESPEDKVNGHITSRLKSDMLPLFCIMCALCTVSMCFEPHLMMNAAIAAPFTYLYTASPTWLGFRIKTLFPLAKNIYVSLIWLGWVFGSVNGVELRHLGAFVVHFALMMISNILQDVKDIKGDRECGVQTLPVIIGLRPSLLASGGLFGLATLLAKILLPDVATEIGISCGVCLCTLVRLLDTPVWTNAHATTFTHMIVGGPGFVRRILSVI